MNLVLDAQTRAQLRRSDPWEVRGAYEWVKRMRALPQLSNVSEAKLMSLAPLAAEIREDVDRPLGVALRGVSEGRVRRLLASDREDIVAQLAKAVRLVGKSVSVADVIETAVFWGESRKRHLAAQYFHQDAEDEPK